VTRSASSIPVARFTTTFPSSLSVAISWASFG
jgi:hypothetical protein